GLGTTLDESEPARRGNSSHVLAPPEAMAERFAEHPEAVHESGRIAELLAFDLTSDLGYQYPGAEDPHADRKLAELCQAVVHERYGHDRSALVAAFSTFHSRSAIRDFGKALGIPPGEVERAARSADPWGVDDVDKHLSQAIGRRVDSPRWRALMRLVRDSHLLQRHMSQHPGGMVISTQPLDAICPIQPAAMDGRQMVQWDKESCADAGFLKIDLLGLGMLSAVERCVDEIARVRGGTIDISRTAWGDEEVYREIQAAETMGVFQIESRAQMQMLKRTLPASLDD